MKISVITVCYNAERTIGTTIESFLAQSYPDKELIVVDGASRDGTVQLVESFASPQIAVHSEPDRGLYDAMNKGLTLYHGDAVGFLNADDCFSSDTSLTRIAEGLADCDMVSGDLDFVRDHASGDIVRRWRGTAHRRSAFRRGWMAAHPTFYVRRRVVDAVGRFDLTYRIAADYDYMLRAYELHGFKSRHIDEVLVHMQAGGASTAGLGAYLGSNMEALRSRQRWLGSGIVDYALVAKPMRKLHQFFVRQAARSTPSGALPVKDRHA
ncbi:MAG: glycosyltransferase family 2 protein [Hyphomicrobiales bacterium]